MKETRKREVCAGSVNHQVKRHHFDTTISYHPPLDFNGDDDSLTQILARLPARSLIRFQSVCKSWFSIISSDYFRRLHTLCKPSPSLILTALNRDPSSSKQMVKISELSYYSNQGGYIKTSNEKQRIIPCCVDDDNNVIVLRCCNGLVLLWTSHGDYCVYNPTTNHSQIIIPFHSWWYKESVHLLFDPSKSPHRYKIVCFREDRQDRITAFDSESGKWSQCVEGFTTSENETCLFYFIHCGLLYCFNILSQFIVCPLPKLADQGLVYYDMLQESSNGCLYYCAFVGNVSSYSSKPVATLWELQLIGGDPRRSKWLLKYHHSAPRLPAICLHMLAFIRETSTVLIRVGKKIMAYSFRDKSYKELLPHSKLFTRTHCFVHVDRLGETLP